MVLGSWAIDLSCIQSNKSSLTSHPEPICLIQCLSPYWSISLERIYSIRRAIHWQGIINPAGLETVQNNLSPLFSPFPNSTKVQRSDPRRRRITVSRRCRLPQLKTVVQNFKKFNRFGSITNAAEPGGKLFIVMEVDPPQAQMRSLATEGDGKVPTPVPQSEPPASPGSPSAQPLCRLSPSHTQTRGSKWLRFSQLIYFLFLPNEVSGQFLLTWLPSPQRWGGKGGLVGVPRPAKLQTGRGGSSCEEGSQ